MAIEISKATYDDAEKIAILTRLAYQGECDQYGLTNKFPNYPTTESVREDIDTYEYYKVLYNKSLVGGIYLVIKDNTVTIEDLCIHPDYQSKGIGTYVMNYLEKLLKNYSTWLLVTPVYSIGNQRLYERLGYNKTGCCVEDGIEVFTYRKELPMNQETKAHWNKSSDDWYKAVKPVINEIKEEPMKAFPSHLHKWFEATYPSLEGLNVLVPSSGDNTAAFAFHLLGARVTSVDISDQQLFNAKKIADQENWAIEFICDDSMSLEKIKNNAYDLVYTSNGVHVWISDLHVLYKTFHKKLKKEGTYIAFDTHPMGRPFSIEEDRLKVVKDYQDNGYAKGIEPPHYWWRTMDHINNLVLAGFNIKGLEEFTSRNELILFDYIYSSVEERQKDKGQQYNFLHNPDGGLPQCIAFLARKE
jgi:SAM-dependent methyltransferase/GNAT superfamily N-acetyltransferase